MIKIGTYILVWLCFIGAKVMAQPDHLIQGTERSDALHGGPFSDEIHGGEGDDEIYGGKGADILYGGLGADRFIVDVSELDSLDRVEDLNPDEGDSIVLTFRKQAIKNMKIPKELGTESVKIDRNGNLKILMENYEWVPVMDVKKTDMYLEVENESSFIRFVFKKKL